MLKSRLLSISISFAVSCILSFLLYFLSDWKVNLSNGFNRKFPSHKIRGVRFIDLKYHSWYPAGAHSEELYFGNYLFLNGILKVDCDRQDTVLNRVSGFDTVTFSKGSTYQIDSTNFYLLDGIKRVVASGKMSDLELTRMQKTPPFTAGLPLSPSSFILRVVTKGRNNTLIKQTNETINHSYTLEKQGDGVFSTDGMLIKSPDGSKIIYAYYYRNQFICADTNLNVLYKGKTIDTVSHANIKVARIESEHAVTLAAPPVYVNKHIAANNKWLFVHSGLRADNEVSSITERASVIDVYSLSDGKYAFSFYLLNMKEQKLNSFIVFGDSLVAIYDDCLYSYKLNF